MLINNVSCLQAFRNHVKESRQQEEEALEDKMHKLEARFEVGPFILKFIYILYSIYPLLSVALNKLHANLLKN